VSTQIPPFWQIVMGKLAVHVLEPPGDVTVTLRPMLPLGPARKAIMRVPAPAVSVPFVTVQAYVAPAPASGTEALVVAPDMPGQRPVVARLIVHTGGVAASGTAGTANVAAVRSTQSQRRSFIPLLPLAFLRSVRMQESYVPHGGESIRTST